VGRKRGVVTAVKRDYYEVLGVSRDADEEAVRRSFLALARDSDAEERFGELAEAYSVLSRWEARLLYDRYGYRGRRPETVDEALRFEPGVEVALPPEDPRTVRYIAFVLLLAAIVTLVLYLSVR
jgi:curved DNA-binding protein CbpA